MITYHQIENDPSWFMLFAKENGKRVGTIFARQQSQDIISLRRLFVEPEFRRHPEKIATQLHGRMIEWAINHERSYITLELVPEEPSDYPTILSFLRKQRYKPILFGEDGYEFGHRLEISRILSD